MRLSETLSTSSVKIPNRSLDKTCNKQLSTCQLISIQRFNKAINVNDGSSTSIGYTVQQNYQRQHAAQQSHHYQRNSIDHIIINYIINMCPKSYASECLHLCKFQIISDKFLINWDTFHILLGLLIPWSSLFKHILMLQINTNVQSH